MVDHLEIIGVFGMHNVGLVFHPHHGKGFLVLQTRKITRKCFFNDVIVGCEVDIHSVTRVCPQIDFFLQTVDEGGGG